MRCTTGRAFERGPTQAADPHTGLYDKAGSNDAGVRFPPVISPFGCDNRDVLTDFEHRYRAVRGRDVRFDGWFYVAVTSTGIYCRPSCPAATPKRSNVRFYPTAAAAQYAGFRACKRCRPDAVPGSPEWDTRADIVARAMRLIADGVVDRDGVAGRALRRGRGARDQMVRGEIPLRLPFRTPFDANGMLRFLGARAVAGIETFDGETYRRTLRLPHGAGVVALSDGGDHVRGVLKLENLRDLGSAVQRCRSLLDLDADPVAVSDVLGSDPLLR